MAALIGLDLGTGSVKALVVSETGDVLGRGAAEYAINRPRPDWAEQDPAVWRRAAMDAVHQALAESGSPEIAAIGLSGQMHGAVLLDRDGEFVRPAIIWADGRSVAEAREITERVGPVRLIEIAGSPVVSGFQAATCRWASRHEPEVWKRVAMVLTPKDEIRRWLTGEISTEPSDASATLLFDLTAGGWSDELLEAALVRRDQVPEVGASGAVSGFLKADVADELGLPAGIPVSGGVADAPGAALGAGAGDAGTLLLTISTGAQALIPAEQPLIDRRGRIHSFAGPLDSPHWYAMGATMSAGMSLRWLRDNVFGLEQRRGYDIMNAAAEASKPGSGGLIFLPYLSGERTPLMDPSARGVLLGLTGSTGRGELVRAVMEGVAFSLFDAFSVLRELGADPARIALAGGGAQSALWRRIIADVFALPVLPALDPDQSAIGAAMTAGAAAGWFTLAEVTHAWRRYEPAVEPDSRHRGLYAELLAMFRAAYLAHRSDFERLRAIALN